MKTGTIRKRICVNGNWVKAQEIY